MVTTREIREDLEWEERSGAGCLPALLTADQACYQLGISKTQFWALCKAGRIPLIRLSTRVVRVPRDFIEALAAGTIEV